MLSADGRYVVFTSTATNLVTGDANGVRDVFVKDQLTGAVRLVSTSSSGTQGNNQSFASAISADGRSVLFSGTASNLVQGDTNGLSDVFFRDLRKAGVQQLAGMVVSNAASARITLDLVRNYQEELAKFRSGLGTALTRVETFSELLESTRLTYEEAHSRIVDADVAEETTKLTSASIRQQAIASLNAQANQTLRIALQLLQAE
jgi:flagellin-like hook-associated protein FlgL